MNKIRFHQPAELRRASRILAMKTVRARIAPSPTGYLHVGTARSALFNELYAHQNGGQFIVRIEDTDKNRSKLEYEESILKGLNWLGLNWDEGPDRGGKYGPYRQSERNEAGIYRKEIERLLSSGAAYQLPGEEAVKFKVPTTSVRFTDLIRGEMEVNPDTWGGDFVIARSLNDPLFHLAVVVDDALMEISHVIRGEDHLTNTARHVLLQQALGYPTPQYAHLPLLLDDQRKKLSKRQPGTDLLQLPERGYLPEAVLNYLALLGWNSKDDQEIFTHDQLLQRFSLTGVQKGGAIYNPIKLDSLNKEKLKLLHDEQLLQWGRYYFFDQSQERKQKFAHVSDESLLKGTKTEIGRISSYYDLDKILNWLRPEWVLPADLEDKLIWKDSNRPETIKNLQELHEWVDDYSQDFTEEALGKAILSWIDASRRGRGNVLWPMRFALTGLPASPGPFAVAATIGKKLTLMRLAQAAKRLQ